MHALILAIALAGAATPPSPAPPRPQHIDVDEDEVVEGGTAHAEGDAVFAKKAARFGTLLKLRQDFRAELLRSADGVR